MVTGRMPTKPKHGAATPPSRKRKSKGKQHPLHAESLDRIAEDLMAGRTYPSSGEIAQLFRREANRVRSIVR